MASQSLRVGRNAFGGWMDEEDVFDGGSASMVWVNSRQSLPSFPSLGGARHPEHDATPGETKKLATHMRNEG